MVTHSDSAGKRLDLKHRATGPGTGIAGEDLARLPGRTPLAAET